MRNYKKPLCYLLLSAISLFFIFPVVWVLVTSLKAPVDAVSFWQFTQPPRLSNYRDAWNSAGFSTSFFNTLLIAIGAVALSLVAGFLMAYSLIRAPIGRRMKGFFQKGINFMRIIPEMVFLIPLFVLYQKFGLYDTKLGLVLAFQVLTLPYCILLLCNFIVDLPEDLEWAARLDGCSELQVLTKVVVPLTLPGIVTSGILSFITVWTSLMFPLALSYSQAQTIAVSISSFKGYGSFNWPVMAAAALMVTIPQIILFSMCNKYLISGYTMGAVKE